MKLFRRFAASGRAVMVAAALMFPGSALLCQDYVLSFRLSPVISWLHPNISTLSNKGTRTGFDLSASVEKYFADHFAVTGGLSFVTSGGRLVSDVPYVFKLHSSTPVVPAGKPVIYKVQYLTVPVGLKFRTSENNLISWFGEAGFDPGIVIRGRVDIPVLDLKDEKAMTEIKFFSLGYHLTGGMNYSVGETTFLSLGVGFGNNFTDLTKDVGGQEKDKTAQRFLKFVFGINFLPSWE